MKKAVCVKLGVKLSDAAARRMEGHVELAVSAEVAQIICSF